MDYGIRLKTWSASPTSKAGLGFYPSKKYIGAVTDAAGYVIAETGKCGTREAALAAANKLRAKLREESK